MGPFQVELKHRTFDFVMKKLVLLLFLLPLIAQAQLFKGGIVAGANFSQVEGDDVSGYKHLGYNVGFMVDTYIKEKMSITFEILYTIKGSDTGSKFTLDGRLFRNTFRYVEVPVLYRYHDDGGMSFGAGLSFSNLISATHYEDGLETEGYFDSVAPLFSPAPRKMDYGFVVDFSYRFSPQFWISARGTVSTLTFYDRFSFNRGFPVGWRNNAIYLRSVFVFNALGKKRK